MSRISRRERKNRQNRRMLVESLEARNLLAADAFQAEPVALVGEGESGEGESTPLFNLSDFATALSDAGVKFFGSDTCPVCARQKSLFGDGADLLPYINVTNPDGSLNDIGVQNNIQTFPTWDFPDGSRQTGFLTVEQLSEGANIPHPTNIVVINTNKGNVEIKLRPDSAPETVENWLKYANDGDYDNTIFHRLVQGFVLQGGGFATTSETFTSTNQLIPVPTDPPVVNEFGISNTRATVAMAKLGNNPNSATSQFFFNLVNNAGNLDNQNGGFTVFAEVLDMATVDQLAQTTPFNLDGGVFASTPIDDDSQLLTIRSVEGSGEIRGVAFEDANGDGVRDPGESALANVMVYVDDNDNGVFDTGELSATSDANGDYSIVSLDGVQVIRFVTASNEIATTGNSGRHVVDLDIAGVVNLDVGRVTVTDVAAIDLAASSDTGADDTDNVTHADNSAISRALDFVISGAIPNAIVRLFSGNQQLGQAAADQSGVANIRTNGNFELDGPVTLTADQVVNSVAGPRNTSLDITVDDVAPTFSTTAPTTGKVAIDIAYDADTDEEGSGVKYTLQNAPSGASIDEDSGQLTWAPASDQIGDHAFSIVATDEAGNATTQPLNVQVLSNEQLVVRLETTDLADNFITEIDAGEQFKVRAFVRDNRINPQGVEAAFIDLIYQNQFVIPNSNISYGPNFASMQSGDISTLGVIDEVGAAGNSTIVDGGELLLFEVTFTANAGGTEIFAGEAADIFPDHDSFLIGDANPAPTDVIKVESTSILVNLSFGANGENFGIDEDSGENQFLVLENDIKFDGSTGDLFITGSSLSAQNATIRIAGDGQSIFYTPPANFVGVDSFTYSVSDGNGTDSATVIVNVLDVNDPPVAGDDTFNLDEDAPETLLDVIANSDNSGPDQGETLSITDVSTPDNGGQVRIGGAGSFLLYTPGADKNGVETFTYTLEDNRGGTAQATVTINLAALNDAPVAVVDEFNLDEDAATTVFDPLNNDVDRDNDELTISSVGAIPADQGVLSIINNGQQVEFTPAANFNGVISTTYMVSDGNGGEAENSMIFRVANINDDPTAVDDTGVVTKNTGPHSFNVTNNDDIAPDTGETLTVTEISGVVNGVATIGSDDATIVYTPNIDFIGEETITYTVSDGRGGVATATLTITVRDFDPSSLAGAVFIDANENGMRDFGETPVGGAIVRLTGSDNFGVAVDVETTTDANGNYRFAGLAPGSYEIKQTQPSHLINGSAHVGTQGGTAPTADMLRIDLPEGTQGEANNFTELGKSIQFVRLRDFFLRPQMPQAEVFQDVQSGTQNYALGPGWENVQAVVLDSPDNGQGQALLRVTDNLGVQQAVTIPLERVETRTSGNTVYRRILSSLADLGVHLNGDAPQGEGERNAVISTTPPPASNAANLNTTLPLVDPPATPINGEGESRVDGVFATAEIQTEPLSTNAAQHAEVVQASTDELFENWTLDDLDDGNLPAGYGDADDDDEYAAAVDQLLNDELLGEEGETE